VGERLAAVVLVVDDHPVVRRGLSALLAGETWVARSVEAAGVVAALALADEHDPDVAVVDVGLPDGDGVELTRLLRTAHPHCRVLVLTMTADADLARQAMAAGASGFLVKETDPEVVLGALRTVAEGGLVLGPHVPDPAHLFSEPASSAPPPFHRLTPREIEMVRLVARGHSNGDIARRMSLADKTVRNQISGILTKTGVADRVQLVLAARDRGLLE
jgi:two-component system nitrate/nitrite response regulator NarL